MRFGLRLNGRGRSERWNGRHKLDRGRLSRRRSLGVGLVTQGVSPNTVRVMLVPFILLQNLGGAAAYEVKRLGRDLVDRQAHGRK
jgi:hypothetical protein